MVKEQSLTDESLSRGLIVFSQGLSVLAEASMSETKHSSLSFLPNEACGTSEGHDTALLVRNGNGPFLMEADPMFLIVVIFSVASGATEAASETTLEHLLSDSEELGLNLFDVSFPIGSSKLFSSWSGSGTCLNERAVILLSDFLILVRKLADFLGKVQ